MLYPYASWEKWKETGSLVLIASVHNKQARTNTWELLQPAWEFVVCCREACANAKIFVPGKTCLLIYHLQFVQQVITAEQTKGWGWYGCVACAPAPPPPPYNWLHKGKDNCCILVFLDCVQLACCSDEECRVSLTQEMILVYLSECQGRLYLRRYKCLSTLLSDLST